MRALPLPVIAVCLLCSFFLNPSLATNAEEPSVKEVDPAQAAALLAKADEKTKPVVLDIRTAEEFAEGHIDGARNINFSAADFEARITKLDRNAPFLVHCRSGGRSGKSLAIFKKLGFKNIYHLEGGILAWKEAGKPLKKAP